MREVWAIFKCHRAIQAAFKPIWATFELFGRTLRVGAPELHLDLKLKVTGTRNRREKVGHEHGTYPNDFPSVDTFDHQWGPDQLGACAQTGPDVFT